MITDILQNTIWQTEYFNNTFLNYTFFLTLFAALSLGFFTVKYIFFRKLSKLVKDKKIFSLILEILDKIRSPFYIFISFYISSSTLVIPELLERFIFIIAVVWITFRVVIIGYQFIDYFFEGFLSKKAGEGSKAMVRTMGNIAKGVLWIFALLVVLSIFGVNVTGLVAGMGIGGVAVAFALQGILSDLFSSFSIYLDKPFIEGDFISVGDKWGTVERIGIKSTRIRSIHGEEIVFSNKELTSVQVHNFRNMNRRRAEFAIGVVYETPTKKMEKIPKIVSKIVEKEEMATFDRVHFHNFGDFSLDYTLVYYIETRDYATFMDINQKVLLNIKKAFEKEKIEFAYPTKTIHLTKSD